ncbi:MAG TPA: type II secretion system protein GspL [Allosphingosinicella sp.]|jgi:general secretion pathway protein L|nr:type II secretion system protein GspL [Allosphingosinicella sp.]
MPISIPDSGAILLAFAGEGAAPGRWLLIEGGRVTARGEEGDEVLLQPGTRTALAVPGAEVALHWLDLAEGLAPAQAAAAARLMLADASANALADMHVAVGLPERDLTPVALAPAALMEAWTARDPDIVIPTSLLLPPPEEGLARRDAGAVPDYRGPAAAFSVEPEIARLLVGEAPIAVIDEEAFEAGLAAALSPPVLNLRQGAFARRRQWRVDGSRLRRVAWLALALAALSLIVQLAQILAYSASASRIGDEAAALAARAPSTANARLGFTPLAATLFEAIRAVPNVELSRLDYRPDGILSAIVTTDSPASLAVLRQRIEASGLIVQDGAPQPAGGARTAAELLLRPA